MHDKILWSLHRSSNTATWRDKEADDIRRCPTFNRPRSTQDAVGRVDCRHRRWCDRIRRYRLVRLRTVQTSWKRGRASRVSSARSCSPKAKAATCCSPLDEQLRATLAPNRSRLWSVRKDGQRVATLDVALCGEGPCPGLVQLKSAANSKDPFEVRWAARQWLNMHLRDMVGVPRPEPRVTGHPR